MKTTSELIKIVAVGGGIIIDASKKTTSELIKIVAVSKNSGCKIVLRNASTKTTAELINIGTASNGNVIFEL